MLYKYPVRTSQETHYICVTRTNRLMVFRETVAGYCENHTEHTHTLCVKNAEFWYVKTGGTCSNHWALRCVMVVWNSHMSIFLRFYRLSK
jgi:hypothetical protein